MSTRTNALFKKKTHKFVGLKRLKLNKWKIAIKKASGFILSSSRFDNIPITKFPFPLI